MTRQAYELVRGRDDDAEAMVVARLSRLLCLTGEKAESARIIPAGIELARRSGHFRALSMLHGTAMMLVDPGPDFQREFDAALAAARQGNQGHAEYNLLTNAGYIQAWCGNLAASRSALEQAIELGARLAPSDRYVEAGFVWLLSLTGDYEECVRRVEPLRDVAHVPTRIMILIALGEVAERRGDAGIETILGELSELAERTGEAQRTVPTLALRARFALDGGALEEGQSISWQALDAARSGHSKGSHWMFSPDLARALCAEHRVDDLKRWVADIEALTAEDPHPHNAAAAALCRAFLASATTSFDDGRTAFRRAAELYGAMPCPARQTEALIGLAELELLADRSEDSVAAAGRAQQLARQLGAEVLTARATAVLERAETPPVLATVLVTDIVGSTEKASEVGDRAWNALLERHHALVRRELERFKGREIDTAGDGFLVTFGTPAQGIRCALAIGDALGAAGIEVRQGLHTGECQILGDKLTGLAVHIAARVASSAAGGEILVSGTVRDVVARSGVALESRGSHTLKGVPGEWALFAVCH